VILAALNEKVEEKHAPTTRIVYVEDIKRPVTDRKSYVEMFLNKVGVATRFVFMAVDLEGS